MSELPVVFVAFDGVQSIDVAGPHEVFANAGDAATSLHAQEQGGTGCGWHAARR